MRVEPIGTLAPEDQQQHVRLVDGAQQFEAMMLQEMLKPLQFGEAAGSEEGSGGASETIRGMGMEAVSKGIVKGGGFGVARQIVRQVEEEKKRHSTKVL